MRIMSRATAGLALLLLLCPLAVSSAPHQLEQGALLVFPLILTEGGPGDRVESFLTLSNILTDPVVVHVEFINGASCTPCDLSFPLGGSGTETLVVSKHPLAGSVIRLLDLGMEVNCSWDSGFVIVTVQDGSGNTIADNVLIGGQVTVEYASGHALALPSLVFQGLDGWDGDQNLRFDDVEYKKLPRLLGAEFLAPNSVGQTPDEFDAHLTLFTPGFQRQTPPITVCTVTGYDTDGNEVTAPLEFGCWVHTELEQIDPRLAYPDFGTGDQNGWLTVDCQVEEDGVAPFDWREGGVHGVISQFAPETTVLRRASGGPSLPAPASWARLLNQSVTSGDPVTLGNALEHTHAQGTEVGR